MAVIEFRLPGFHSAGTALTCQSTGSPQEHMAALSTVPAHVSWARVCGEAVVKFRPALGSRSQCTNYQPMTLASLGLSSTSRGAHLMSSHPSPIPSS